MTRTYLIIASITAMFLLTACGGGGGISPLKITPNGTGGVDITAQSLDDTAGQSHDKSVGESPIPPVARVSESVGKSRRSGFYRRFVLYAAPAQSGRYGTFLSEGGASGSAGSSPTDAYTAWLNSVNAVEVFDAPTDGATLGKFEGDNIPPEVSGTEFDDKYLVWLDFDRFSTTVSSGTHRGAPSGDFAGVALLGSASGSTPQFIGGITPGTDVGTPIIGQSGIARWDSLLRVILGSNTFAGTLDEQVLQERFTLCVDLGNQRFASAGQYNKCATAASATTAQNIAARDSNFNDAVSSNDFNLKFTGGWNAQGIIDRGRVSTGGVQDITAILTGLVGANGAAAVFASANADSPTAADTHYVGGFISQASAANAVDTVNHADWLATGRGVDTLSDVRVHQFLNNASASGAAVGGRSSLTFANARYDNALLDASGDSDDGFAFFVNATTRERFAGIFTTTDLGAPLTSNGRNGTWNGSVYLNYGNNLITRDLQLAVAFGDGSSAGTVESFTNLGVAGSPLRHLLIEGSFNSSGVMSGKSTLADFTDSNKATPVIPSAGTPIAEFTYSQGALGGLIGAQGAVGIFRAGGVSSVDNLNYAGGFVAAAPANTADCDTAPFDVGLGCSNAQKRVACGTDGTTYTRGGTPALCNALIADICGGAVGATNDITALFGDTSYCGAAYAGDRTRLCLGSKTAGFTDVHADCAVVDRGAVVTRCTANPFAGTGCRNLDNYRTLVMTQCEATPNLGGPDGKCPSSPGYPRWQAGAIAPDSEGDEGARLNIVAASDLSVATHSGVHSVTSGARYVEVGREGIVLGTSSDNTMNLGITSIEGVTSTPSASFTKTDTITLSDLTAGFGDSRFTTAEQEASGFSVAQGFLNADTNNRFAYAGILSGTTGLGASITATSDSDGRAAAAWSARFKRPFDRAYDFTLTVDYGAKTIVSAAKQYGTRAFEITAKYTDTGIIYGTSKFGFTVADINSNHAANSAEGTVTGLIGNYGAVGVFVSDVRAGSQLGIYAGGFVARPDVPIIAGFSGKPGPDYGDWTGSFANAPPLIPAASSSSIVQTADDNQNKITPRPNSSNVAHRLLILNDTLPLQNTTEPEDVIFGDITGVAFMGALVNGGDAYTAAALTRGLDIGGPAPTGTAGDDPVTWEGHFAGFVGAGKSFSPEGQYTRFDRKFKLCVDLVDQKFSSKISSGTCSSVATSSNNLADTNLAPAGYAPGTFQIIGSWDKNTGVIKNTSTVTWRADTNETPGSGTLTGLVGARGALGVFNFSHHAFDFDNHLAGGFVARNDAPPPVNTPPVVAGSFGAWTASFNENNPNAVNSAGTPQELRTGALAHHPSAATHFISLPSTGVLVTGLTIPVPDGSDVDAPDLSRSSSRIREQAQLDLSTLMDVTSGTGIVGYAIDGSVPDRDIFSNDFGDYNEWREAGANISNQYYAGLADGADVGPVLSSAPSPIWYGQLGLSGGVSLTDVEVGFKIDFTNTRIDLDGNGIVNTEGGFARFLDGSETNRLKISGTWDTNGVITGEATLAPHKPEGAPLFTRVRGSLNGLIGQNGLLGVIRSHQIADNPFVGGFVAHPDYTPPPPPPGSFAAWAKGATILVENGLPAVDNTHLGYFIGAPVSGGVLGAGFHDERLHLNTDGTVQIEDSGTGSVYYGLTFGGQPEYYAGLSFNTNVGPVLTRLSSTTWEAVVGLVAAQGNIRMQNVVLNVNLAARTIDNNNTAANPANTTFGDDTLTFSGSWDATSGVITGQSTFDDNGAGQGRAASMGTLRGLIGELGAIGVFRGNAGQPNPYAGGFVTPPAVNYADWQRISTPPAATRDTTKNEFLEASATHLIGRPVGSHQNGVLTLKDVDAANGDIKDGIAYYQADDNSYAGVLSGTSLGAPIARNIFDGTWQGQMRMIRAGENLPAIDISLDVIFNTGTKAGTITAFQRVHADATEHRLRITGNFNRHGVITGDTLLALFSDVGDPQSSTTEDRTGKVRGLIGHEGAVGAFLGDDKGITDGYAGGFVAAAPVFCTNAPFDDSLDCSDKQKKAACGDDGRAPDASLGGSLARCAALVVDICRGEIGEVTSHENLFTDLYCTSRMAYNGDRNRFCLASGRDAHDSCKNNPVLRAACSILNPFNPNATDRCDDVEGIDAGVRTTYCTTRFPLDSHCMDGKHGAVTAARMDICLNANADNHNPFHSRCAVYFTEMQVNGAQLAACLAGSSHDDCGDETVDGSVIARHCATVEASTLTIDSICPIKYITAQEQIVTDQGLTGHPRWSRLAVGANVAEDGTITAGAPLNIVAANVLTVGTHSGQAAKDSAHYVAVGREGFVPGTSSDPTMNVGLRSVSGVVPSQHSDNFIRIGTIKLSDIPNGLGLEDSRLTSAERATSGFSAAQGIFNSNNARIFAYAGILSGTTDLGGPITAVTNSAETPSPTGTWSGRIGIAYANNVYGAYDFTMTVNYTDKTMNSATAQYGGTAFKLNAKYTDFGIIYGTSTLGINATDIRDNDSLRISQGTVTGLIGNFGAVAAFVSDVWQSSRIPGFAGGFVARPDVAIIAKPNCTNTPFDAIAIENDPNDCAPQQRMACAATPTVNGTCATVANTYCDDAAGGYTINRLFEDICKINMANFDNHDQPRIDACLNLDSGLSDDIRYDCDEEGGPLELACDGNIGDGGTIAANPFAQKTMSGQDPITVCIGPSLIDDKSYTDIRVEQCAANLVTAGTYRNATDTLCKAEAVALCVENSNLFTETLCHDEYGLDYADARAQITGGARWEVGAVDSDGNALEVITDLPTNANTGAHFVRAEQINALGNDDGSAADQSTNRGGITLGDLGGTDSRLDNSGAPAESGFVIASADWNDMADRRYAYAGLLMTTSDLGEAITATMDAGRTPSATGTWKGRIGYISGDNGYQTHNGDFTVHYGAKTIDFATAQLGSSDKPFLKIDGDYNDFGVIHGTVGLGDSVADVNSNDAARSSTGSLTGLIGNYGAVGAFVSDVRVGTSFGHYAGGFVARPNVPIITPPLSCTNAPFNDTLDCTDKQKQAACGDDGTGYVAADLGGTKLLCDGLIRKICGGEATMSTGGDGLFTDLNYCGTAYNGDRRRLCLAQGTGAHLFCATADILTTCQAQERENQHRGCATHHAFTRSCMADLFADGCIGLVGNAAARRAVCLNASADTHNPFNANCNNTDYPGTTAARDAIKGHARWQLLAVGANVANDGAITAGEPLEIVAATDLSVAAHSGGRFTTAAAHYIEVGSAGLIDGNSANSVVNVGLFDANGVSAVSAKVGTLKLSELSDVDARLPIEQQEASGLSAAVGSFNTSSNNAFAYAGILSGTTGLGGAITAVENYEEDATGTWSGQIGLVSAASDFKKEAFTMTVDYGAKTITSAAKLYTGIAVELTAKYNDFGIIYGTSKIGTTVSAVNTDHIRASSEGTVTGLIGNYGAVGVFVPNVRVGNIRAPFAGGFVARPDVAIITPPVTDKEGDITYRTWTAEIHPTLPATPIDPATGRLATFGLTRANNQVVQHTNTVSTTVYQRVLPFSAAATSFASDADVLVAPSSGRISGVSLLSAGIPATPEDGTRTHRRYYIAGLTNGTNVGAPILDNSTPLSSASARWNGRLAVFSSESERTNAPFPQDAFKGAIFQVDFGFCVDFGASQFFFQRNTETSCTSSSGKQVRTEDGTDKPRVQLKPNSGTHGRGQWDPTTGVMSMVNGHSFTFHNGENSASGTLTGIIGQNGAVGAFSGNGDIYFVGGFVAAPPR